MPRYCVCNRCGTYNTELFCETCKLSKEEGKEYEEIREVAPLTEEDLDDQEDWLLTSVIFEEEEDDNW